MCNRELRSISTDADQLSKHGFFLRCLKSSHDEETLKDFKNRIEFARQNFMVRKCPSYKMSNADSAFGVLSVTKPTNS